MIASEKQRSEQRTAALTAGISLLIMTLASFFSYGFVHGSLIVQGDAGATFHNILSSTALFKAEIFGWVIILICDIVVAWAFYIFLRPIQKSLSLLGAWFRLTYATLLGIAILNLLIVLILVSSADSLSLMNTDQLQAHVSLYLEAFDSIWSIGLVLFGGHLLIVGFLAFKSNHIPKAISILLMIAGTGYLVIHLGKTFLPQYEGLLTTLEYVFTVPMIVGELGFGLWLLFRGGAAAQKA